MTMTIDAAALAAALRTARHLAPLWERRPVRLLAEENAVRVSMADLNQGLAVTIPSPAATGEFVIDHRYLSAALTGAKSGAVLTITESGTGARLAVDTTVGPKATRAPILHKDSLVQSPEVTEAPVPISFRELKRLLATIKCAVPASETSRYYLAGVHLVGRRRAADEDAEFLTAEAADGRMVSITRGDVPVPSGFGDVIMAHESIGLIAAMPIADEDVVGIAFSENAWCLTAERLRASGKLVDGTYPNVPRVFPTEFGTTAVLEKAALQSALDAVVGMTAEDKDNRGVFIGLRDGALTLIGGGLLRDSASHARIDVDCHTEGPPCWWWCNSSQLQTILSLHRSGTVRIRKTQGDTPAVIDDPDDDLCQVAANVPVLGPCWPEWAAAGARGDAPAEVAA